MFASHPRHAHFIVLLSRFVQPMSGIIASGVFAMNTSIAAGSGVVRIDSHHAVAQTAERLEALLKERGIQIFAHLDFAADAARAGLTMRPEQMLIFGNPKGGTPLMQARPTVGLDLPLKALIWEDAEGRVTVAYNDPQYVLRRHGLPPSLPPSLVSYRSSSAPRRASGNDSAVNALRRAATRAPRAAPKQSLLGLTLRAGARRGLADLLRVMLRELRVVGALLRNAALHLRLFVALVTRGAGRRLRLGIGRWRRGRRRRPHRGRLVRRRGRVLRQSGAAPQQGNQGERYGRSFHRSSSRVAIRVRLGAFVRGRN